MISISWCLDEECTLVSEGAAHATGVAVVPVPDMQVGSTMIRSPGLAASMAAWIEAEAATCVGALPPMVTVTVSMVVLPLPAVMTSCPHRVCEPPYCTCCWTAHSGIWPTARAVAIIVESVQLVTTALIPPIVTFGQFAPFPQVEGRVPKP